MTEKLTSYDPAAALVDDEEIAFFMADAFETGDSAYIAKALGLVARAKGMTEKSSFCFSGRVCVNPALPIASHIDRQRNHTKRCAD